MLRKCRAADAGEYPRALLEGTPQVRQGLRFLHAELPRPLTMPPDVLSPRMVGCLGGHRGLAGDRPRLDKRIEQLSG